MNALVNLLKIRTGLFNPLLRNICYSIILLFCYSLTVQAQTLNWTGQQTLTNGQNITQDINLTGNVTVNVASGTATISGVIRSSDAFSLTKTGEGKLIFTANNTYTGNTIVNMIGGTIQIGNGTTTGAIAGNISLNTGSSLFFNRSNDYTYSGVISGIGSVEQLGTGKTILTGANTYTGGTFVYAGTLQIGNDTSTTASIGSTSGVTVQSGSTLRFELAWNMTFSKEIRGAGKVELKGNAVNRTLYLTANNTYTGTTTVEAGFLYIGNGLSVTAGRVAGDIILHTNTHLYFDRTDDIVYSGVISGAGHVAKICSNKLTLTGANTYTGITTVSDGTLQVGDGTSTTASINSTSDVWIYLGGTLRFEPGANMTFSKVIGGAGKVQSTGDWGSKALYLTGDNTYTGTTTIETGSLAIGNNTTTGAIAGPISINNGAYLDIRRSNEYTYANVISGAGNVYKYNAGKFILTGANTYTGATSINGGTLQAGDGTSTTASIGSTSGVTVQSGSTLRFEPAGDMTFSKVITGAGKVEVKGTTIDRYMYFTANNTYTGTTTLEAGRFLLGNNTTAGMVAGNIILNAYTYLHFNRSDDIVYSGVISGAGNVYKYGTNKLTLNNANTYTGFTGIANAGTLALGANGSIENSSSVTFYAASKFDISAGNKKIKALNSTYANTEVILGTRTLTIGTSDSTDGGGDFAGIISGTGSIIKTGSGKQILTGANTYTGSTTINGGTLQAGDGTSTTASIGSTSGVSVASGATLRFEPGTTPNTFSKVISGLGKVELKGNATTCEMYFTANNIYTGTTTVEAGRLLLGNNTAAGMVSGNIILNDNTQLYFRRSDDITYSGVISGTGHVFKYGTNKLTLNNANTYSGNTSITYGTGTLALTANGSIENSATVSFGDNAKFDISAGNKTIKTLNAGSSYPNAEVILGTRTLTIGTSGGTDGNGTFAGKITGTGGIVKNGTGKQILTGANTYTGATTINAGTLELGGTDGAIAGNISIASGATLSIARTNNYTYAGVISGAGGVTKTETGFFLMSGANTATGVFQHNNGGVFFVSNKWAGAYNKAAGTTLSVYGDASIGGALTLAGGDIFMITSTTPASKLTVGGAVSASGTNTINIDGMGTANNYDLIVAASGIPNTTPYALTGATGYSLVASGTKLTLVKDGTAKTVSVGTQNGTMTAGTTGTVTFPVTTANITNGSYTATVTNLPAGVSVSGQVAINNNNGTLTLSGNTSTVAGTTNTLRLTINETQSGQFTLTVSPAAPTYSISASSLTSFGSLQTPYTQPAAQTVTITNTGTGSVTLTQPTATNYDIGTLSTATLAANGATATFTVRPKAGLPVGTYNATINVNGTNGASTTVSASFSVTATAIQTGNYTGSITIVENAVLKINETVNNIIIGLNNSVTAGKYTLSVQSIPLVGAEILPPFVMDGVTITGGVLSASSPVSFNIPSITIPAIPPLLQTATTLTNVPVEISLQSGTIAGNVLNLNLRAKVTLPGGSIVLNFDLDFSGTWTAAIVKSVSVGAQVGKLTTGITGSVTFPVYTVNIANGNYTATVNGLPTGVAGPTQVAINSNSGTLTLYGYTSTVAGTTNTLQLTIDGTQSAAFTLTIEKATSIDEVSALSLKAYPNPFTDALRITGAEGCTLRVMNIAGSTVFTQQIISSDETLGLKYMPAGLYFFRFEKEGNAKTVKVIKN